MNEGMNDYYKTKAQLIEELSHTRKSVTALTKAVDRQKQTVESLQKNKRRFQKLLNSINDVIWIAFIDGSEKPYLNAAAEHVYGRNATDFAENPNLWFEVVYKEDIEHIKQSIHELNKLGHAKSEYRIVRPDGELRWITASTYLFTDKLGKPVRIGGIATDITERIQAEESLRENKKILEQQNELLNEKNTALREMFRQIDSEKNLLQKQILANVDKLILPIITHIKAAHSDFNLDYIQLLEDSIKSIVSNFNYEIYNKSSALSSREIEISNMIRNGLSSKEIAHMLNLSVKTIHAHRHNIRKKLDLQNKAVNLSSYLKSLE